MKATATIVAIQCGLTAIFSFVAGLVWGELVARSVLVGGAICAITTFLFGLRVFAGGKADADTILRRFYVGEAQKLVVTGVLFFVSIRTPWLAFLPLLCGYIVALAAYWISLPFSLLNED